MTTFLLVGHTGFQNRGCEAIVQSTRALLRERFGNIRVILSSTNPQNDAAFAVPGESEVHAAIPGERSARRWASRLLKVCGLLRLRARVRFVAVLKDMAQADVVLSIGGDLYSMDYGFPADQLYLSALAYQASKPLVIWGASIGPFPSRRIYDQVTASLRSASLITVRESLSRQDLADHGVASNVRQVFDPAFALEPDPVDTSPFWPQGDGVLGLNVASVLGSYSGHHATVVVEAAAGLVERALEAYGLGVLLIPHVVYGAGLSNEHELLKAVAARVASPNRVRVMPNNLTAAQTKHVISQCRLLMATRTHATIAGFSTGIPTASLSCTRKALGINQDLFSHQRYVCDISQRDLLPRLTASLETLIVEETVARQALQEQRAVMASEARRGVDCLASVLGF